MKIPIDVATRVSRELSTAVETMVNDADREEPPTLADVRAAIRRRASAAERREEALHPQQSTSILAEVDDLIEEFGPDAPAIGKPRALISASTVASRPRKARYASAGSTVLPDESSTFSRFATPASYGPFPSTNAS